MKKHVLFFVLIVFKSLYVMAQYNDVTTGLTTKPGSGNTLQFNGTNQYVSIADIDGKNDFDTYQDFTVECWVNVDSIQPNTTDSKNCIIEKWSASGGYPYVIRYWNQTAGVNAGKIIIGRFDGTNNPAVTSNATVNDNQWHHIAFVRSGGASGILSLYIDGISQGSSPDITTNSTLNNSPLFFGRRGAPSLPSYFKGKIDEVRIWNTALTQNQVRDRMSHKIKASDPLYSKLVGYYNFDESDCSSLFDCTEKPDNGMLVNAPARTLSGASIGDASAYTYGGNSVKLKSRDGGNFKADKIKGNPESIHLYRVDKAPSVKKGIKGLGPNKTYFGVFPFGGSNVKYNVTYNYSGNPYVIQANEDSLKLFTRLNNADNTWTNKLTNPDTATNILTANNNSTGEFILGSTGEPLQVPKFVSINDTAIKEGDAGNKTLKIPVHLNEPAVFNSSVNYTTEDSTATGEDYVSKSGTVNFIPGQLTDTISIKVKGDTKVEQDEIFKVVLGNPVNIAIADSIGLITIKNNDPENFSISDAGENNDISTKRSFKVQPNPAKDFITIVSSNSISDTHVTITDINGKALYHVTQNFIAGQQLKINLSQFSKQVLIIGIESNNYKEQFKIVKE